jgi:hypothetical protein
MMTETRSVSPSDNVDFRCSRAVRVVDQAQARLGRSAYPIVRNVVCSYDNGTLVLTGRVSSYYLKQIAQTVIQTIDGVDRIMNELEVIRQEVEDHDLARTE